MGLHPYAAAMLLGALALLVMGYLLACERLPRDPDGPSGPGAAAAILAACLLSGSQFAIAGDPAQGGRPCLPGVVRAAASADSRICWAGVSAGMPGPLPAPGAMVAPGALTMARSKA